MSPASYREIGIPPEYSSMDAALVDIRVQTMASDSHNKVCPSLS